MEALAVSAAVRKVLLGQIRRTARMGRAKKRRARVRHSRLDLRNKVQRRLRRRVVWVKRPGMGRGGVIVGVVGESVAGDSAIDWVCGDEGRRIRSCSRPSADSSSLAAASCSGVASILKAA